MDRGQKIFDWIKARHADGRTVYAATYTKTIKLAPKHAEAVRYHNGHCEVRFGKRWDSINFCNISAA